MIDKIKSLFTSDYLLAPSFSGLASRTDKVYLAIALLLTAGGFAVWAMIKKEQNPVRKNLLIRKRKLAFTIGLLGLVWAALRYEGIAVISARWIIWLIYLCGIIWGAAILRYYLGPYKELQQKHEKELIKNRYL